jgi:hypothetical protein
MSYDDGITFDADGLKSEHIREGARYGGIRLRSIAFLSGARIPVLVDVGFGDSTAPGIEEIAYPVLLDLPAPKIYAYARETVVAEKLEAMISLGRSNTRMKDFYDIWILSKAHRFEHDRLCDAVASTLARRGTALPSSMPVALTPAFSADPEKQSLWKAFAVDLNDAPSLLFTVVEDIQSFLAPVISAIRKP